MQLTDSRSQGVGPMSDVQGGGLPYHVTCPPLNRQTSMKTLPSRTSFAAGKNGFQLHFRGMEQLLTQLLIELAVISIDFHRK